MAKYNGYLNTRAGEYLINSDTDYISYGAMVIDTLMNAGISLFNRAQVNYACHKQGEVKNDIKRACSIMNALYAWKIHPEKRQVECATSWLDDAWCTLHKKYVELQDKEIA